MPLNHVRTIYENINAAKKFYSAEKSGFSTAGEALFTLVTDLINTGAMTLVAARYRDTDFTPEIDVFSPIWPIGQRQYKLINPGKGYTVNDQVILLNAGNASVPYTAKVTAVRASDNGIAELEMSSGKNSQGEYPIYQDSSVVQPNLLSHTEDWVVEEPNRSAGWFKTLTNISLATGSAPTTVTSANLSVRPVAYTGMNTSKIQTTEDDKFGALYGNVKLDGVRVDRLPGNAIIVRFARGANSDYPGPIGWNNMKIGQRLILQDASQGNIHTANTYITSINRVSYATGRVEYYYGGDRFYYGYREQTEVFYQITVNQAVTLNSGANVKLQGWGATINNEESKTPDKWTAILNSAGAIDPMSDPLGVIGNVVSATTNSNVALINTIAIDSGGGSIAYAPTIYPGQRVTNTNTVGDGVSGTVTVLAANMTSATTATVTFSSNQTLSTGKTLRFRFDPLQDWRLAVQIQDVQVAAIYAGTEVQFGDDGNIPTLHNDATDTITDRPGVMGIVMSGTFDGKSNAGPDNNNVFQGFINRKNRVRSSMGAVPLNTQLTLTDRGMFFGVWEGNFSVLQKEALAGNPTDNAFNWFLIQRPVDRVTGRVLTTGRAPLFCINSVGYAYHKFIVRESDVFHPSQGPRKSANVMRPDGVIYPYRTPADAHSNDSFAVLNSSNQVALTEDSKYLVSFLQNLTTPRFRYSEELDIIGQTSADVCISSNELSITAYQESGARLYKALPSNKPYNTGLRIVVLKNIP